MFYKNLRRWSLPVAISLLLFPGCGEKSPETGEAAVVAEVGEACIRVKDFRLTFEGAISPQKRGPNPKMAILQDMIREKLLALEGYRQGVEQRPAVRDAVHRLRNELMVEALLEEKVKSRIRISREEIEEAINKSKVSFKFRYWSEGDRATAEKVAEEMRRRGYSPVVDELIAANPEQHIDPARLTTDYLTNESVPEDILAAIGAIPIGDISQPLLRDGRYFIFQVLDIRRSGVTTHEYDNRAPEFEQKLFWTRYIKALGSYGDSLLNPLEVRTSSQSFEALAGALAWWDRQNPEDPEGFIPAVMAGGQADPSLKRLAAMLDDRFYSAGGRITQTRDFLGEFDAARFLKKYQGQVELRSALHQTVGEQIRDRFLLAEAQKEDLADHPIVKEQIPLWQDKWVYSEMRKETRQNLRADSSAARRFFEAHKARFRLKKDQEPVFSDVAGQVRRLADQYRTAQALDSAAHVYARRFPVTIHLEVLDTIRVTRFEKSPGASTQFFRSCTNRQAYPLLDPIWQMLEE